MPIPEYIRKIRTKIGHDLLLMPGVSAVVINDAGEVLLQCRKDNGQWSLISGVLEPDEEPANAIAREVMEETGVEVIPERIVGIYSGPDYLVRYPNEDVVQYVDLTFACRPLDGTPRVNDDESLAVQYFPLKALPPLEAFHQLRIEHTLRNDPRTFFRVDQHEDPV